MLQKLLLNLPRTLFVLLTFIAISFSSNAQFDSVMTDFEMLSENPDAFRKFLETHPEHVVNLKGKDLTGKDLSNMNLRNADLSYANLTDVSFKESDLTRANFMGSKLINTDLSRCNLSYADFDKTNATGAIFTDSLMKNAVTTYLMIQDGYQLNPAVINADGIVEPASK